MKRRREVHPFASRSPRWRGVMLGFPGATLSFRQLFRPRIVYRPRRQPAMPPSRTRRPVIDGAAASARLGLARKAPRIGETDLDPGRSAAEAEQYLADPFAGSRPERSGDNRHLGEAACRPGKGGRTGGACSARGKYFKRRCRVRPWPPFWPEGRYREKSPNFPEARFAKPLYPRPCQPGPARSASSPVDANAGRTGALWREVERRVSVLRPPA